MTVNVELLRAAMVKASEYISPGGHGRDPRLMHRYVPIAAEDVAAEYDRLVKLALSDDEAQPVAEGAVA